MTAVRYDIRVRTLLGPAMRDYLARCDEYAWIRCGTVFRLQLSDDADLTSLYERLVAGNVDVISIRRVD
jgi:hypothetical protein